MNFTTTTALGGVREQFRLNELSSREDQEQVIELNRRHVFGYIVLITTSIQREDAGEYRCVVNNTAGQQTEVNITVNVQGEQVQHLAYIATSRKARMCKKNTSKFVLDKLRSAFKPLV